MKRYHMMVEGRVQGVGFRSFCMMLAQTYGLTGSVTNLENGMVEIFVQGEEKDLDIFFKKVQEGNRFIRVENMTLKEIPVVKNEKRFTYGYFQMW